MHFKMSSAIRFNLDQSKILSSGNELGLRHFTQYTACFFSKKKKQILAPNMSAIMFDNKSMSGDAK